MGEVIAIRVEEEMLYDIDRLSKQENSDRSTLIRTLIRLGYGELIKKKVAELYLAGKITISEAARRSGLTIWDMEKYLVDNGFVSKYSIEDLENELRLLK